MWPNGGLEGFSECLRQELEPFNLFVTLIEPGGARTSFSHNLQFASEIAAYRDTPAGHIRKMVATAGNELYALDPQKIAQRSLMSQPATIRRCA
jgi:NAD(P)-dependent dehydrogenase (short-subunit alcohol dehydrogenase family)